MEVICAILVALFGIGFGIFMALQPEDAIALSSRRRYTQVPEPTVYPADPAGGHCTFGALCRAFGGAAVRAQIRLCSFPLADFFSPCYNEKKRRRFLLWSSTLFSGS